MYTRKDFINHKIAILVKIAMEKGYPIKRHYVENDRNLYKGVCEELDDQIRIAKAGFFYIDEFESSWLDVEEVWVPVFTPVTHRRFNTIKKIQKTRMLRGY